MTFDNNFPGVRALVDVIGRMESVDFNLMFRLLREGVTLEQLRKWYWEREDYLFMAPVHTVIDIARFTFTWRGRVLIARAFPDTSSLSSDDVVLIRRLPASTEYFTIIYGVPPVLIAASVNITGASNDPLRFAYTLNIQDTSPVWVENSLGLPSDSDGAIHLFGDGATEYLVEDDPNASGIDWRMWRNTDPLGTGVWELVLNQAIINSTLGTSFTSTLLRAPVARSISGGESIVYVGIETEDTTRDFIAHSHDEGSSWTIVELPNTTNRNYYSMVVGVANPELVYVYGAIVFGINTETIVRSLDGGHSFFIQEAISPATGIGYIGMPVSSNPSEQTVFLGSAASTSGPTLRRSTDGADTFSVWSAQQHRPIFSRTNALSMWDIGGGTARRVWRSADQGLIYDFVDVGLGGASPYAIQDGILHKDSLMVIVGRRAISGGFVTGPAVWSSPDKINWTGRDGNLDAALYHELQTGQRPLPVCDFYTIAKQQVVFQG